jgi:hypothetical protein
MSAEVMIGAWRASYSHWGSEKINPGQILTTPPLPVPKVEVSETPLRRQAQGFFLFSFQPRQHP